MHPLGWPLAAVPPESLPGTLEDFRRAWRGRTAGVALPFDRALLGGTLADRLGFAFAAGYQSALEALLPDPHFAGAVALCVTEAAGNHPRAIATKLAPRPEGGFSLSGHKRWTTLAQEADALLVAASAGTSPDGRNAIRLVRVAAGAPGVRLVPMPETPFVPEIAHAEVVLDDVRVEPADVLPGDGYERYVRPFRTVEDIHVLCAALAYLTAEVVRQGLPRTLAERLLAVLGTLRELAQAAPDDPAVHVALGGALALGRALLDELESAGGRGRNGLRALSARSPDLRGRGPRPRAAPRPRLGRVA